MQWVGHAVASEAASVLAVAMTKDVTLKTKKNLLKVQGVIWGSLAAYNLCNLQEGPLKKDKAYASAEAAGQAALAALCLWKGFEDEF